MTSCRWDTLHASHDTITLAESQLTATIQLRPQGAWDLRVSARGIPLPERSGAARGFVPQQIEAQDLGDGRWRLSAADDPDVLPLELNLDPFSLRWAELSLSGIEVDRRRGRGRAPKSWTFTLDDSPQRRYYGLGERTGQLNKRGRAWLNWNTDQPDHHPWADPLYQSHPLLIAADGAQARALFLDDAHRSCFDLSAREPDRSTIRSEGPAPALILIPGPRPLDLLRHAAAILGRAPLPPLWSLGYHQCRWSYPDEASVRAIASEMRRHELPCDAIWLDIDTMDGFRSFTLHPQRFPDLSGLAAELAADGLKMVTIVDPALCVDERWDIYRQARDAGYFITDDRDRPIVGRVWPKRASWPDFSRPEVRAWWGELQGLHASRGFAGIWNDMNEPALFDIDGVETREFPPSARHGARSHAEVHNLYGSSMAEATFDGLKAANPERRPFVLTRAGFSGIQRHAFVWTGDNGSSWEQLAQSIPMLLNLSLSGVPFCGADIGGFFGPCNGELLARWTWAGAFIPFMRNHSAQDSGHQEPWVFGDEALAAVRAGIALRYELLPLIYSLAEAAATVGLPLIRPLFVHAPDEPEAYACESAFTLGADLLVAPILEPGMRRRLCYLPAGDWVDVWTGESHSSAGEWRILEADWPRIPLLQRAGAALPLTDAALHTGSARWSPLRWQVARGPAIKGRVFEDEGDGPGAGAVRRIRGTEADGLLQLELDLDPDRPTLVELLGPAPLECSAPMERAEGRTIIRPESEQVSCRFG